MPRTPRDESDGMIMTLDLLFVQIVAYSEISGDAMIEVPWLWSLQDSFDKRFECPPLLKRWLVPSLLRPVAMPAT